MSPTLMDWLRQVPSLSRPLGDAVATLDQAAEDLASAERARPQEVATGVSSQGLVGLAEASPRLAR